LNISSGKGFPAKRILFFTFNIFATAIIISTIFSCMPNTTLVTYQRTGGIAGFNDRLVIDENGHCLLQRKSTTTEFDLASEDSTRLRQLFKEADFFNLNSQYLPENIGADRFEYIITYRIADREHTVRTMDGAVPAALEPVLSQLNQIISDNTP
jgi:hypothetical protein